MVSMAASNDDEKVYSYNSDSSLNPLSPPPPYNSLFPKKNIQLSSNKDQIDNNNSHSSSTITTNVKDYISRSDATISPIYSTSVCAPNSSATELYEPVPRNSFIKSEAITEQLIVNSHIIPNKTLNIMEYRSNSSNSADDTSTGASSMNESLERIGTSLQKLIEEAQASLVNPQQSNNEDDTITERNKTSSLSDYSYQYIQNRYIQSQEKLGLALDQLEKSIQYIPTMIMTKEDHYYHHHHTPSHNNEPAKTPKRPFKIPWATLGLVIVLLVYSLQRPKSTTKYQHIHVSLLLLLISSFYRRVRLKHHIINPIDYCILRLNLSKGTPAICGFIHRLNLVLCLLLHK